MADDPVVVRVPALTGGISDQPAELRLDGQVEDADNATCFLADGGASCRPPTRFVTKVAGLATGLNLRLHRIVRDQGEKYLVIYGLGVLKVVNLVTGLEAIVQKSTDAEAYLNLNSATADQQRLATSADFTLIANTTVQLAATGEAIDYEVTSSWKNYDVMAARVPEPLTYHHAENDTAVFPAGYYQYLIATAGDNGWGTWVRNAPPNWRNHYGRWDDSGKNPMGFKARYQRQDLTNTALAYVNAGRTLTKAGAFTNYTFDAGDQIRINNFSNGDGYYAIASKTNNDEIVLAADARLVGDDASCDIVGISKQYEATANFVTTPAADMHDVMKRFQDSLRTAGATDAIVGYLETGPSRGQYIFAEPYRGTGTGILELTAPAAGFDLTASSDRPFHFASGTNTLGSGSPATPTVPIEERWEQVPAPGDSSAELDSDKMPVQMVRESLVPLLFTVSTVPWKKRVSGDNNTNPIPSLWAKQRTLADLAFHLDRLVFIGDENIVCSQSGDVHNFFKEDAVEIVESDPIDKPAATDQVTLLDFITPFRGGLLLTSKAAQQYELASEGPLTPASAAVKPSTALKTLSVQPVSMGGMAYFAAEREDETTGVYEYQYNDFRGQSEAPEITKHVRSLIPSDLRTLAGNENLRVLFALPIDGNELFVNFSHWEASEKTQNAWTRYTFDPSYRICDVSVVDDRCYMLVEDHGQYFLEYFPIHREIDNCDCGATTTTTTTTSWTLTTTTTTTPTTTITSSFTTTSGSTTVTNQGGGGQTQSTLTTELHP